MNALTPRPPIQRPGRRTLALLVGLALSGGALAQWQWRDANGSRVFSDTPPPPGISDAQILRRPVGSAPAAAAPSAPAPVAAATPTAGAPASRDPGLEDKVKQAEEQKRKADEQRIAKMKADNCQRARQYKQALDSGQRISRTNAQGEREILDEKGLSEEARRNQQAIAENCG